MKFLSKKVLFDLIFVFLLSLTPLLWFKGSSVMGGHDLIFPLNPLIFLEGRLFTWISHNFGQSQALIMGTIPIHFIDAFPSMLGFSLQTTQEIVYIFWFFAMGISAYFLAKTINNTRVFKLTSVVMLLFNFFLLNGWFIGERTKFSAYVALFLILAIFIKTYKGELKVIKGAICNSLIFFVFNAGGLFGISLYGGLFLALTAFIIFFSFLDIARKKFVIKKIFLLSIMSSIGFVLINAYYIVPALTKLFAQYSVGVLMHGGVSGFVDWASEISAFASYSNIFRLQGIAEWYDNPFHPYSEIYTNNPWFISISFIFPALIFLAVYIHKRKDKAGIILYFFLLYLLGIIFTAGTHPPLGFFYEFLINNIPGFIIFRSPYFKFAPALFLSSSFLIAYLFDYLKGKKRLIFTSLFILLVLVYHFPYFAGNFFEWRKGYSTRVIIPTYVFELGKWMNYEKKDDLRILVLPPNDPAFQYNAYDWKYLSFQSLPTLMSNKSVVINNDQLNNEERILLLSLYDAIRDNNQQLADKLFSVLGIQYLLIEKDKIIDPDSLIPPDTTTYERFAFLHGKFLRAFGKWTVYKLDKPSLPPIYLSTGINILNGSIDDTKDYFSQSNSTAFMLIGDNSAIADRLNPISSSFYFPECLNCPDSKSKPVIQIPKANILPGSSFYPLVLFKERLSLNNTQGTSKIYDDLGLSLKRISEVKAIGIRDGRISNAVLKQYSDLLRKTFSDFNKLTRIEDKMKVADDISYYMKAEQGYLFQALDSYVATGHSVTIDFSKVYIAIDDLLTSINNFIYKPDPVNNRLYKIVADRAGEFEIILKRRDLATFLKKGSGLEIGVDDKYSRELKLSESNLNNPWFSFGKIQLTQGAHYLSLSFPEPFNLSNPLTPGPINFNFYSETNCYTTKVNNYGDKRLYKVKINYENNFASDLVFYIWERKDNKNKLINLAKLKPEIVGQEYTHYVQSSGDSAHLWAGICSEGLTRDVVDKKINIVSQEIIFPTLLLKPITQPSVEIKNVKFAKISPVKYRISFENNKDIAVLNFTERYDAAWKLQQFDNNHYRGQGYDNSWIIDKKGNFDLILEYTPQRAFTNGYLISICFVLVSIGYLVFSKYKRRI